MRKHLSGLIAAGAMAATVGLGAQAAQGQNPANTPPRDTTTQSGSQRTPGQPPSTEARGADSITVTGCVQNAPAQTAGAAGAAGAERGAAASAKESFVLANATTSGSGAPSAGAVGTTGSTGMTYRLEGDTSTLSKHVNQRVQIRGRLQSSSASATGAASAAAGSTAAGPALRVESVTMLSGTCDSSSASPGAGQQRTPAGSTEKPESNQPQGAPNQPQR
jgi:hypothetical protein